MKTKLVIDKDNVLSVKKNDSNVYGVRFFVNVTNRGVYGYVKHQSNKSSKLTV